MGCPNADCVGVAVEEAKAGCDGEEAAPNDGADAWDAVPGITEEAAENALDPGKKEGLCIPDGAAAVAPALGIEAKLNAGVLSGFLCVNEENALPKLAATFPTFVAAEAGLPPNPDANPLGALTSSSLGLDTTASFFINDFIVA